MSFKEFDQSNDISVQISAVNEIVPITGSLLTGSTNTQSYVNITSGSAVSGGFWETVYDGAPTSTSSSALLDLTYGHSSGSLLADYGETYLDDEKQRVYREMAQLLLGNVDSLFSFNSTFHHEIFFVLFKRRIYKDEISKGNTVITLQVSGGLNDTLTLSDTGAASSFTVGPAGDEASLFSGSTEVGKVYYNVGIAAFVTGVFVAPTETKTVYWSGSANTNLNEVPVSGTIDNIVDGLKNRINQIDFNNQTNLHSTHYFCRAFNSEFNYSTNPTFVDSDGRILPTSGTDNQTRTYITKVGMYDVNSNLLAVGSLSEPVKKSPDTEVVVRVRLSY